MSLPQSAYAHSTGTVRVSVHVFPHESVKVTAKGSCVPAGQLSLMANLNAWVETLEYNKYVDDADELAVSVKVL
jgi:hypothetical protein